MDRTEDIRASSTSPRHRHHSQQQEQEPENNSQTRSTSPHATGRDETSVLTCNSVARLACSYERRVCLSVCLSVWRFQLTLLFNRHTRGCFIVLLRCTGQLCCNYRIQKLDNVCQADFIVYCYTVLSWVVVAYLFCTTVAKLLDKPDDKVGRCEWERVGCVWRHRYLQHLPVYYTQAACVLTRHVRINARASHYCNITVRSLLCRRDTRRPTRNTTTRKRRRIRLRKALHIPVTVLYTPTATSRQPKDQNIAERR